MSEVRWCDKHEGVFPIPSAGWSTGQATQVMFADDGKMSTQTRVQDVCGPCNGVTARKPRKALAAAKPNPVVAVDDDDDIEYGDDEDD